MSSMYCNVHKNVCKYGHLVPTYRSALNMLKSTDASAQGSGGVSIPEGAEKTCRCGTLGHGLVGMVVLGLMVGPDDLRGLFQP